MHSRCADTKYNVLYGHNDWLFMINDSNFGLDYHCGYKILTQAQIDQFARAFQRMPQYPIPYVCCVYPDKEVVYQEQLPDDVKINPDARPLKVYLSLVPALRKIFIDLLPTYLQAKTLGEELYFRHDTHHNYLGGYHSYRAILSAIQERLPQYKLIPLDRHNDCTDVVVPFTNDLGQRFSEGDSRRHCSCTKIVPKIARHTVTLCPELDRNQRLGFMTSIEDSNLPTAIFFHDSFTNLNAYLLAEHFRKAYFIWSHGVIEFATIERLKPDIVVTLIVERFLANCRS